MQSLECADAQRKFARGCPIEYRLQSQRLVGGPIRRKQVNRAGVYAASEILAFNADDENVSSVRITTAMAVAPQYAPARHVACAQAPDLSAKKDDQMCVENP